MFTVRKYEKNTPKSKKKCIFAQKYTLSTFY